MPSIFDALPGLDVPPGSISKSLTEMWADTAAKGGPAPAADDVKATQVNLVLHFGFNASAEDGAEQFQSAVRFSQRYPCRVVVLCPQAPGEKGLEIRAKIYGECHLGKSKGDTRCCEFVFLNYSEPARQYLEDLVSVCLSTDLPLYYWAHRFSSSARLNEYQYLLKNSQRVIFDSAVAPADAFTFPWPKPEAVRDLAQARLLHVRQSIGQFLSSYSPALLSEGLLSVQVASHPSIEAEARVLVSWVRERLINCGAKSEVKFAHQAKPEMAPRSFEMRFEYSNSKGFVCRGDFVQNRAELEADFGSGKFILPVAVSLLNPEAALAEAMFF